MSTRGRKPIFSGHLLTEMRSQIVDGLYPAGTRLPTRRDLWQKYRTTPVTLQRVFRQLAAEGFVVARGREGTFVSERPPHLSRFALVFPYRDRPERPWPQFWRALATEAGLLKRANGHEFTFSYGNETHEDIEAYRQLLDDVAARRLAGLIFATRPFYLRGSPVLETPGIPRVAIASKAEPPNVTAVQLSPTLFDDAVARLQSLGARRIAMIAGPAQGQAACETLRQRGVDVPAYWVQTASHSDPTGVRHAVQLLMSGAPSRRPDGLVIADDNLVPEATAALRDSGLRVPEDLCVIGHANFPHPTPSAMPIERMGTDVREVLRLCLEQLDAQRAGKATPDIVQVPVTSVLRE